jgi:hypothetical protein
VLSIEKQIFSSEWQDESCLGGDCNASNDMAVSSRGANCRSCLQVSDNWLARVVSPFEFEMPDPLRC